MDSITFKHSFNAGDLITVLPGIKHICEKNNTKAIIYQRLNLLADYGHNDAHPVHSTDGKEVCMNETMFNMLKPLIMSQDYVAQFEIWKGQPVQFDYDKTRHSSQMPLPGGSIHKWPSLIFPQLECDLNAPWVIIPKIPDNVKHGGQVRYNGTTYLSFTDRKIIVNRTNRYTNPYITYFFLKEREKDVLFVGTKDEYEKFKSDWDLDIPMILVDDFHGLATVIRNCKLFIGNQSFCWHLADAMKVPRILEVCALYPNTFPTGMDGYSFITQEALEFRFHKILNDSNVRTA